MVWTQPGKVDNNLHESVECHRRAMRRWQGGCATSDVMFAFLGVVTMARREHSHSTLESHARHMPDSCHYCREDKNTKRMASEGWGISRSTVKLCEAGYEMRLTEEPRCRRDLTVVSPGTS